ncbi:MAG: hypothetical protein NUV77_12935, partial [Thermoguttaceae bacterium]|nr:hypothetical protein [Thermoguttaceae bacterium]
MHRAFPPIAVGFLLIAWAGEGVSGAAPAGSEKAVEVAAPASPEALRSLIRQLDSEQYAVRQRAADRLRELARRPETASALAQEVQRVLHAADTSFEVRRALESLSAHLPPATEALPPAVNAEEIDRLVRQLEHDDFGRRAAARRRLEWLAGHPELVCPILLSVKARLDTEGLPVDARRWIEPVYKQTRRAWLTSDPKRWALPPLSEAQIARWIDDLVRPVDEGQGARTEPGPERAMRELSDAMARDEYTARIQQALEARLARPGLDGRAASRIRRLLDLTRPAMAAECWGRLAPTMPTRLVGTQSLIVGEPSLGPGAERPSHFDRI